MASHGVPRVTASETKSEETRAKQAQEIERYRELVNTVNSKVAARDFTTDVLTLTSKLLTKNPEYYTIWNHRRKILLSLFGRPPDFGNPSADQQEVKNEAGQAEAQNKRILALITTDLNFLIPLLKSYPKCYWLWNYRIWLLEQSTILLPTAFSRRLWTEELKLVGKMLGLDSRNFHGWRYRRIVVEALEKMMDEEEGGGKSMVKEEFEYTTQMIRRNLSNFSAWHYRSKLIPHLLNEQNASATERRDFLDKEFELVEQALIDPYDQSIWFYHQFLMSTTQPISQEVIAADLTGADRAQIYEREMSRLRDVLLDTDDSKWVYQALLMYSAQYLEIEGGNKTVTTVEMRYWMNKLMELDPLRMARWKDLEKQLGL